MNTIRKTVGFVLAVLLAVSLAPGMVRAADSCQARFVKNEGRVYTYALDVPELKDSYPINTDEAEEDDLEPGKLEVGGASRDSTGFGALEEGLISS